MKKLSIYNQIILRLHLKIFSQLFCLRMSQSVYHLLLLWTTSKPHENWILHLNKLWESGNY